MIEPTVKAQPSSIEDVLRGSSPSPAPATGNTDATPGQSPADGQPGATSAKPDVNAQPDAKAVLANKETQKEDKQDAEGEDVVPSEADLDKAITAELGLQPPEEETVEVLRTRYSESSKEAKRLKDELTAREREAQAFAEFLRSQGVKQTKDNEGKFQLLPDEGYVNVKTDELSRELVANLTDKDREEFIADPENAARGLIAKVLAKTIRPVPTATAAEVKPRFDERLIPTIEREVSEEKFRDGKPKYPDMGLLKPYMKRVMESALVPPDFKDWAMQTPEHYKFAEKAIYGMVLPIAGPQIAARLDRIKQMEERKKRAGEDVIIGAGSAGSRGGTRRQSSATDDHSKAEVERMVKVR